MENAEFDTLPADFLADPYRYYARLRAEDPIHLSSRGVWILTRYDDVAAVLRDPRFGRKGFGELLNGNGPQSQAEGPTSMLFQDPPAHRRLRTLVGKAFTLSLVQNCRSHIQRTVDDLFDGMPDSRVIDLIADFAFPLPVRVMVELLGVPASDRDLFHKWSLEIAYGMEVQSAAPVPERTLETHQAIADYFRAALADRRRYPQDDLLTKLIAAQENDDRLTEFELLDICGLLFIAGHETTVNLIGNGILALLLHPGELRRLREDQGLVPSAVEEILRYESPVQRTGRMANENVDIGGKTICKGTVATVILGAANRDPVRFTEPDRLDVARRDNRHLTFGLGDHFCLGAALARLEGQIAIGTLLRRLPDLELASHPPAWRHSTETRGLRELPVICKVPK